LQLSLTGWLLGPCRLADALPRLSDLEYRGFETRPGSLPTHGEGSVSVGEAARRAGLVRSVHGPTLGEEPGEAEAVEGLRLAQDLGTTVIVLHPARAASDGDVESAWARSFAALGRVLNPLIPAYRWMLMRR
jgi:sugar phosphate isomerase/epimerase